MWHPRCSVKMWLRCTWCADCQSGRPRPSAHTATVPVFTWQCLCVFSQVRTDLVVWLMLIMTQCIFVWYSSNWPFRHQRLGCRPCTDPESACPCLPPHGRPLTFHFRMCTACWEQAKLCTTNSFYLTYGHWYFKRCISYNKKSSQFKSTLVNF